MSINIQQMKSYRQLLVQSKDRVYGTASDFAVRINPLYYITHVSMVSASIPNTLYNVLTTNNTIYWTRNGTPFTTSVSPGAYSITDLILKLAEDMMVQDPAFEYEISYDTITMKITIAVNATLSLTTSNTTNAIWDLLGFITGADTLPHSSATSDKVVRLDQPNYLLVGVREIAPADVGTTSLARANFVISMTGNSSFVEVQNMHNAFDNTSRYTSLDGVDMLNIRLTDPDGKVVNLNGSEWSCLLGFSYCGC